MEFERQMEERRGQETDGKEWMEVKRGWCLGGEEFRAKLLERMGTQLGKHHSGRLRAESAQAKAERIIGETFEGLKWEESELRERAKGDEAKVELAYRLRRETTLTIRQIAERLSMGSWKGLNNKLYLLGKERNAKYQ